MQVKLGDHEKSLLRAIAYWNNAVAAATDATSERDAKIMLGQYSDELLQWQGRLEQIKQRGARVAVARIAPPPLTFLEILCAPVYFAQLIIGYVILGGMWSLLGASLFGLLFGGMYLQ